MHLHMKFHPWPVGIQDHKWHTQSFLECWYNTAHIHHYCLHTRWYLGGGVWKKINVIFMTVAYYAWSKFSTIHVVGNSYDPLNRQTPKYVLFLLFGSHLFKFHNCVYKTGCLPSLTGTYSTIKDGNEAINLPACTAKSTADPLALRNWLASYWCPNIA